MDYLRYAFKSTDALLIGFLVIRIIYVNTYTYICIVKLYTIYIFYINKIQTYFIAWLEKSV